MYLVWATTSPVCIDPFGHWVHCRLAREEHGVACLNARAVGELAVAFKSWVHNDGVVNGSGEVVREQHPIVGGDAVLEETRGGRIDRAKEVPPYPTRVLV